MWRRLATGVLFWVFATPIWSQQAAPVDLVQTTKELKSAVVDLGGKIQAQDLKFSVVDIGGKTLDLKFNVVDTGGKTENLQVRETATEIRIEIAADVLFDFDKATIKPEAASALHKLASILLDNGKGRSIRIDGHTDGKGSDAHNQKLSERRAESVKQWLVAKEGLGKVKMTTRGFGAKQPVAPNAKPDGADDPDGRQKNRRVEIVLAK